MSEVSEATAPDDEADTEAEAETDNLSRNGAIAMAARLQNFWLEQGATNVRHWVEHVRGNRANRGGPGIYVVRSNLVSGNPPR
jgi:hypothetical protein